MNPFKSIVLICPPCDGYNIRIGENLGIRYIQSYLTKNGFEADIIECDFEEKGLDTIAQKIMRYKIIGISLNYYGQYVAVKKILKKLGALEKKQNKIRHVVAGGHYATFQHKFILKDTSRIDYIILGEGEHILAELIESKFSGIELIPNVVYRNPNNSISYLKGTSTKPDINSLPFPYRNKNSFFMGQKHFSLITSRGCYGKCSFCSVNSFSKVSGIGKRWRLRSPENIVEEIILLHKKYDVKVISFLDSIFIGADKFSRHRALKIFDLLKKNGIEINFSFECKANAIEKNLFQHLKASGLKNVFVGLESGTDKGLKYFNKQSSVHDNQSAIDILKRLEIDYQFGFINFFPEMSYEDFWQNIIFLHRNKILTAKAFASKLCIYHGTEYYQRKNIGIKIIDNNVNIRYRFNDERLNSLFENTKKYAKLLAPFELQAQKVVFNAQVKITDSIKRCKHLHKAKIIRNLINDTLFYIANKIFFSNKDKQDMTSCSFNIKITKRLNEIGSMLEKL